MILQPNCKDCPIGDCPQVPGLGTRAEGTKLFAVRDEDAQFDLVCVAMAPASEEMQRKMPMVGPSGQFLRKTLNNLNIDKYYITNCLLCPIPVWATDADIKLAQKCCSQRFESEILSHKPKLILAMGDMPFHQLCDVDYPITENQGRLFLTHLNVPLVPVAHPAFYLRRPDDAYDFIECTRAGVRYLNNNYHQVGEVTREIVTEENVDRVLEELWKFDVLTLDCETSGFYALALKPNVLLEVGISGNNKHCYIVPVTDTTEYSYSNPKLKSYPDLLSKFKELLETKPIDGWNIFFDWRFIRAYGIKMNVHFDGMLAHYCLDERQYSHGLKKVARVYGGAEDWEGNIKTYLKNTKEDSYALIPTDKRWEYLAKDVCYTNEMNTLLSEEIGNHWVFHNILMPATQVFSETTFRGVPIDPYKLVEMKNLLWDDIQRDERELWDMAGRVFNPMSPPEVARIIYDDLKVPINPKYGRSTNKKIFEQLEGQYELIDRIIEHRSMNHDLSNYVEGFARRIDKNFRVHPTIRMFGAVTGRISSEDPSIMNIKRDSRIKEIFIADKDMLFAEFDLAGAELRWYVIYSQDEVLRDILENGYQGDFGFPLTDDQRRDPHYMIGCIAYGPDKADELRAPAKMTVFGRLYLRSLQSIEREHGREVAQKLVTTMDQLIPNQPKYTNGIKQQIRNQGYVESYFGRQRRYPLITAENRKSVDREAVNMPIQSASSDLNLLNLIYLYKNKDRWGIEPMFTVHDSITVMVPNKEVCWEIKKEMEENAYKIVKEQIHFRYDCKVGPSWGEAEKLK